MTASGKGKKGARGVYFAQASDPQNASFMDIFAIGNFGIGF
jgi:hypothetical protein